MKVTPSGRYRAIPSMLIVAPKERQKLRIFVGTCLESSTHFIVTGKVAADDLYVYIY
jgi:hypothetical protein